MATSIWSGTISFGQIDIFHTRIADDPGGTERPRPALVRRRLGCQQSHRALAGLHRTPAMGATSDGAMNNRLPAG
jgi:hypothetical protein